MGAHITAGSLIWSLESWPPLPTPKHTPLISPCQPPSTVKPIIMPPPHNNTSLPYQSLLSPHSSWTRILFTANTMDGLNPTYVTSLTTSLLRPLPIKLHLCPNIAWPLGYMTPLLHPRGSTPKLPVPTQHLSNFTLARVNSLPQKECFKRRLPPPKYAALAAPQRKLLITFSSNAIATRSYEVLLSQL